MNYIWNIYESSDPTDLGTDPYDIFVYSLRRSDEPHTGDLVYLEGRNCKVIACTPDHNLTEVQAIGCDIYYKVCVV